MRADTAVRAAYQEHGQLPDGWRRLRNKVFMREVNRPSVHGSEEMLSVSHLTGVTPRSEKTVYMFEAESTGGYKLVKPGDPAINTMWAWMGAAGVSRVDGIVSPAYGVYEIDQDRIDPRWVDHVIRAPHYVEYMTRFSRGVTSSRLRLYPDEFLRMEMVIPPLDEQRTIADFLDTETARIDELSAKYELAEQLSTERWRVVTARLLSSACSQHGTVPLKRVTACLDSLRVPLSSEERHSRQGPYPYFGASTVVDHVDDYLFDEELVLLGEDGAQLLDPFFAVSQVVRGKCWVNNHAHVLRPTGFDAELLSFHLNTFDRVPFISGSTRPKITQDDMGAIPVPHVGPDEQRRLRAEISSARETLLRLNESIGRQIRLLVERKQALITAAVTGQLDVARQIAEDAS